MPSGMNPTRTHERRRHGALTELALDLRSAWDHGADRLWRRLDERICGSSRAIPGRYCRLAPGSIGKALADPAFRASWTRCCALEARRLVPVRPGLTRPSQQPLKQVAYFSMEFMLSEALPIYSGGLGNVAGDQLKSASDLGVPVIGVGLLYQQGYFRQVIDRSGGQQALFPYNIPGSVADHAAAHRERGVAAAGGRAAGIAGVAAHLAGPGRPGQAVVCSIAMIRRTSRPGAASPANCMAVVLSCGCAGDDSGHRRLAAAGARWASIRRYAI